LISGILQRFVWWRDEEISWCEAFLFDDCLAAVCRIATFGVMALASWRIDCQFIRTSHRRWCCGKRCSRKY
jgi:hypothetical protein